MTQWLSSHNHLIWWLCQQEQIKYLEQKARIMTEQCLKGKNFFFIELCPASF